MTDRQEPPAPEVMAVRVNGSKYQIWDLPIEAVDELAKRHEVFWLNVIGNPLSSLTLARDIVVAMAEKHKVPPPPMRSAREVWDLFERVPEDLPAEYADGIPKAEAAEPATLG